MFGSSMDPFSSIRNYYPSNFNNLSSAHLYPNNPYLYSNINSDGMQVPHMGPQQEGQDPEDNSIHVFISNILKSLGDSAAVIFSFRMILMTLKQWITESALLSNQDSYIRRIFRFLWSIIGWKTTNQILHKSWTDINSKKRTSLFNRILQALFKLNISKDIEKYGSLLAKPIYFLTGLFIFFLFIKSYKKLREIEQEFDSSEEIPSIKDYKS